MLVKPKKVVGVLAYLWGSFLNATLVRGIDPIGLTEVELKELAIAPLSPAVAFWGWPDLPPCSLRFGLLKGLSCVHWGTFH